MTFSLNTLIGGGKIGAMAGRVVGYLRVSTQDQDLEKDRAGVLVLANEKKLGHVEWLEEKVSGIKDWRKRPLGEVFGELEGGDRIIVPELSRLGRSMLEITEILSESLRRGISVYDVKNGWELSGSIQSKVLAMAFSIAAEIERDLISKRTKEALKARKKAGVKLGRPKGPGKSKLDPHREAIIADLQRGVPKTVIAKRHGTTAANLHNWLKKNQIRVTPL